jgi:nucleoid-associated protein EbfC
MTEPIDFNQIASMLPDMQEISGKMENLQAKLSKELVTAESGGGMVKVTATADMRIKKIDIEKSLITMDDPEMLADLIAAAVNLTIDRCREKSEEVTMAQLGPLGSMLQNSPFKM